MKARKWVPVVTAMALAVGVSESAQAAYALSYDNIFNLQVDSVPALPLANFNSFSTTSGADATLNGTGEVKSATNGGPADSDAANGTGGSVVRTNNTWTVFGPGAGNYSNSDAQVSQTELQQAPGGPVTATGNTSTQAWNIAESNVTDSGFADANGRNSSITGFSFTADLTDATVFTFSFDADPFMRVLLGLDAAAGSQSLASLNVTFSITRVGDLSPLFIWAPDGVVGSGIVGGTETTDDASLNLNISTDTPGDDATYDPNGNGGATIGTINPAAFSSYLASTDPLGPGQYTISLTMNEHTELRNAVTAVPEPASVALVGLGLMGMGAMRRRHTRG